MEAEIQPESETVPTSRAACPDLSAAARLGDLFREWISENPFFVHEVRRRWRKRSFLRLWLLCGGVPALVLILLHALQLRLAPDMRAWSGRPWGLVALSAVSLFHAAMALGFSATAFSLLDEARADRLGFIRLLPMSRPELLAKIGAARALFRLLALLAGLPVYGLALAYGGVSPDDLLALALLYAAFLFAPPGASEISTALAARHGEETLASPSARRHLSPVAFAPLLLNLMLQVLGRAILRPLIGVIGPRLVAVWGTQLGGLLPLSLVLMAARFLRVPQPFFRWSVVPLLPLGAYWLLRTLYRLPAMAEIWAREVVPRTLPGGQQSVYLPEATWLPEELRRRRWLEGVLGSAAALLWIGFFWRSAFTDGAVGFLAGNPTADGGLAAVIVASLAAVSLSLLETVRGGMIPLPRGAWSYGLPVLRNVLVRAMAIGLLGALLGGIAPWPEVPRALLLSALAGLATLLFAAGWRSAFGTREGEPEKSFTASVRLLAAVVLWLASYLLPLLPVGLPGWSTRYPVLHALGVWSPVYLLLHLLPGLWSGGNPVPLPLCIAAPAVFGAVLLLLGSRRRGAAAAARDRPRRDPLEARLHTWVAAQESPFVTVAMHRMLRRPGGVLGGFATGAVTALLLSGAAAALLVLAFCSSGGLTGWQWLAQPLADTGMPGGAVVALLTAYGVLYFSLLPLSMLMISAVSSENMTGRKQGRLSFILISGITDRQIVTGLIGGSVLPAMPGLLGAFAVSLFWLLAGFGGGLPPWWLLPWLAGAAVGVAFALNGGLEAFADWVALPRWRTILRRIALTLRWLALLFLALIGLLVWSARGGSLLPFALSVFWLAPLLLLPSLVLLPRSFRGALEQVHQARHEENLERP